MTRLARLCAAITLLFALLTVATRVVGERVYQTPALLADISACAFACWDGITPGQTPTREIGPVFEGRGLFSYGPDGNSLTYGSFDEPCRVAVTTANGKVIGLSFWRCESIALGDLALLLGEPDSMTATSLNGVYDMLHWRNGTLAVVNGWTSLHTVIHSINLNAPENNAPLRMTWHGFVPLWRSCQLDGGVACEP